MIASGFKTFCSYFPGQIGIPPSLDHFSSIDELTELLPPSNKLEVDDHDLQAIYIGQVAVPDSTITWIKSLRLAVCGTVAYGSGHSMLAYCPTEELR